MNIGQLIAERGKPFYSFEFFPPKDPDQWPDFFKMAERLAPLEPLFTSVTYGAGGSSQDATLEIVSHLKKEFQFETMAHLTCVGATQEHITQYLQRLRDNGVDNVLALRGDIPKGQDIDWETAEFRHAADLVRFAGILPIQSLESIRRTLALCGANIPGKLYLALEEANAKGGAEAVREAGLKFAVQQIRTLLDNGAPGIHLYTLNKAPMCLRIAEEVGAL